MFDTELLDRTIQYSGSVCTTCDAFHEFLELFFLLPLSFADCRALSYSVVDLKVASTPGSVLREATIGPNNTHCNNIRERRGGGCSRMPALHSKVHFNHSDTIFV